MEQSGTAVARLAGGQPGYRPDQHVRVRHRLLHTVAGTRAQQLTMTSSRGVTRMSTGQGKVDTVTRISGAPKTEMHDCSMWWNVGFIRKRLWIRSPGISLPLKMAP